MSESPPEHDSLRFTSAFWEDLFAGYWKRFPWFLSFDKDPEDDDDLEPPPGCDSEEAIAGKGDIIRRTQDVCTRPSPDY